MSKKYINKTIGEELAELRGLINSQPQLAIETAVGLAQKVQSIEDNALKAEVFHAVGRAYDELRQFTEALAWYSRALEFWQICNDKLGEAKSLNNMGLVYLETDRFKEAIPLLTQAANLKLELKEYKSLTGTYQNLGNVYEKLAEHKKAIEIFYKSLKISEKLGDEVRTGEAYQNMGIVHQSRGDNRHALNFYTRARELFATSDNPVRLLDLDINIGVVLHELKKYNQALAYYKKSLAASKAIHYTRGVWNASVNMGDAFKALGKPQEALLAFKTCLQFATDEQEHNKQCIAAIGIGEVYIQLKNYSEAETYLQSALTLSRKTGTKIREVQICLILAKLNETMKDPKKALYYYKHYNKVKDAIASTQIANRINEMQTKYEVAKKEEELIKAKALQTESELKALRAQMDPHFIFNALSSTRKELLEGNIDKADEYIVRFSRLLRLILDTTRTPQVKLSDNIELLHLYIQIEQTRQANRFSYAINVAKNLRPESIFIPGMILQPVIENAIVHGLFHKQDGPGKLLVVISKVGKVLKIKVSDNGVGRKGSTLTRAAGHRSHATSIIRETLTLAWKDKMKERFLLLKTKQISKANQLAQKLL